MAVHHFREEQWPGGRKKQHFLKSYHTQRFSETRDSFSRVKTGLPGQTSGFSSIKNEGVGSRKPCGWEGLPANQILWLAKIEK